MGSSPENLFNAKLTKAIKALGTEYLPMKFSDRFKVGLLDWIIFHEGLSVGLEAKVFVDLPARPGTKVLGHPFEGPQITCMRSLQLAGVSSWGLVGWLTQRKMLVLPPDKIPPSGNFTRREFELLWESLPKYAFDDVEGLMNMIFEVARQEMFHSLESVEAIGGSGV